MPNGEHDQYMMSKRGSDEDRRRTREEIDRHRTGDWFRESQTTIEEVLRRVSNEPIDELALDQNFMGQLDELARIEEIVSLDLPPVAQLPEPLRQAARGLDVVKEAAKGADDDDKKGVWEKYQYAFFGLALVAGAAGIAYLVMQRIANNQATDDLKLAQETKDKCKELILSWQKQTDVEFWNNFANVVDGGLVLDGTKHEWTTADQIIFLKRTADLCPASEPFQWDSLSDANDNAKTIKGFYDATKKKSDLYRNVLKATYKGQPLQRMWAANQLMLVVGSMIEAT
jgi:hypothetical protein